MSENRRVQSPLPGQTSITVEPAPVRANRINSECVEGFIAISEENSDLVPAAQDRRLRRPPTPRPARPGGVSARFQMAEKPPSTDNSTPFTKLESSEARNSATVA